MALERIPEGGACDPNVAFEHMLWNGVFKSRIAVAACRQDGHLLFINEAMLELVDHPVTLLAEQGWIGALYPEPDEQRRIRQLIDTLCQPKAVAVRHQQRIMRGDGIPRLLDVVSTPVELSASERGVVTVSFDVTTLRTVVGETVVGGFDTLREAAVESFWRFDVDTGQLLFATPSLELLTGYSIPELLCEPTLLQKMVLTEYQDALHSAFDRCKAGEATWTVLGIERKDGAPIMLHQAFYPVFDAGQRVMVVEALARDMSVVYALERRLEQTISELRERNEELASLDRLKSRLLANVSHELRTPLVSIKGYNELMRVGALGPLSDRQRRALDISGTNILRLVELIETLIDFAHQEEGRLAVRRARIDLRLPLRDALARVKERIHARGLDLVVDLGNDALEVLGDYRRLVRVLQALFDNAEKFQEMPGQIRVVARRLPDEVEVIVSDTGVGIPAPLQDKIFDRFYQVDPSATRRFGGAGLGLALAREIVSQHGGSISVESEEGKGSTFRVRLPLARERAPEEMVDQPLVLVGGPPTATAAVAAALEHAGMVVLTAATTGEMIRRTRRHRPDALVVAFAVEQMKDALRILRSDNETVDLPMIAVVEAAHRAEALGWADHAHLLPEIPQLPARLWRLLGYPGEAPSSRQRIVVVDDEPGILDFLRFVLEREGYEVDCAVTSEAALEKIDGGCDLAVLDVAIEGSDGIELCRRLKQQAATREVPVLMVTARADHDVRRDSFTAGAAGFLLKPFGVDEFLRQVRLHLREPAARRDEAGWIRQENA